MTSGRWVKVIAVLALLGLAGIVPRLTTSFYMNVICEVMIYGLLAMSIDILAGFTGLVPLGHAGIFGTSTYVVGYLLTKTSIPMLAVIPLAIITATALAAAFALIAIRTTGVYFLMVTLAEGMIVWGIAYRWTSVRRGERNPRHPAPGVFPRRLAVLLSRAHGLCPRGGDHVPDRDLPFRPDLEGYP